MTLPCFLWNRVKSLMLFGRAAQISISTSVVLSQLPQGNLIVHMASLKDLVFFRAPMTPDTTFRTPETSILFLRELQV